MKKYKNLWERIVTIDNFKLAYARATRGKKYYKEVKDIESYGVDKYLTELLGEVIAGKYVVSKYTVFHRITGGKDREIYKLPMKDRIVQHALMNIIEILFRKSFIVDTFSSIKQRGIHAALKRMKKFVKMGYKYYLSFDIKKCYPSLGKEILKEKLSKKFRDKNLLQLLYLIIDSCEKGVPIGNYTSQYFNNFYFSDFDHWIKETKRIKAYIRYCDNMTILGNTKEELRKLFNEIKIKIAKLNVNIKSDYQIYNIEIKGVDVVGYIIHESYVKVRKHTKKNFINKVNKINFNNLTDKNVNVLGSYWGILCHADCRNLWKIFTKTSKWEDLKSAIHQQSNRLHND